MAAEPASDPFAAFLALDLGAPPAKYKQVVRQLRAALLPCEPYARPLRKQLDDAEMLAPDAAGSGRFVREPHLRLVPESESHAAHVNQALLAPFPDSLEQSLALPPDALAAIRQCVLLGDQIEGFRLAQLRILDEAKRLLKPLSKELVDHVIVPANVRRLRQNTGSFPTLLIAALADAEAWPDTSLAHDLLHGMNVVGVIPDTGVFRPVADAPPPSFHANFSDVMASNAQWLERLECKLSGLGERAATDADLKDKLASVERKTLDEVKRGLMGKGMPLEQLLDVYASCPRAMERFGVLQNGKIRACDNARSSKHNDCTFLFETITLPSFDFVARVAAAFLRISNELGIPSAEMVLSLDDLWAAYRRIPNAQPEMTVVALWSVTQNRVLFFPCDGHNFGLIASVTNFSRPPALAVRIARRLLALPVSNYIDDFMLVELLKALGSGKRAMWSLMNTLNLSFESDKSKEPLPVNVSLGVNCDLSKAHLNGDDAIFIASPKEGRCEGILASLRLAASNDYLSPAEASIIHGKLGFTLSTVYGRVGRAALQPLIQRQHYDEKPFAFSQPMYETLRFFEALFVPRPPPRQFRLRPVRALRPLVVYTDAAFERHGSKGLGIVVFAWNSSSNRYDSFFAGLETPDWLLRLFVEDRKTYICQLELLAAVCAATTFPELFRDAFVLHFIDNTAALSSLVHGYSSKPDMAHLANMYHLQLARLGSTVWHEWVPSKANIADVPSRDPSAAYLDGFPAAQWAPLELPTVIEWHDFSLWLGRHPAASFSAC